MSAISIGNELKDSFKPTDVWASNNIKWLTDIEGFYRSRAELEREYATKLTALCSDTFKKKAKVSTLLSVGDTPKVTPGSLESASMVMWGEVLSQSEQTARDRLAFAKDLETRVVGRMLTLQRDSEQIREKLSLLHGTVETEREKHYTELKKAKEAYDHACTNRETARVKQERSGSEKNRKREQERDVEMNTLKNAYLMRVNVANRLKDKYYYQDLPEILDNYQDLNEMRVIRLKGILLHAGELERATATQLNVNLAAIDAVVEQNAPHLDTAMYVKHNQEAWTEPADFTYIPSPIWHDDDTLVVREPELTTLRVVLNQSLVTLERYTELTTNEKQSLEELLHQKQTMRAEAKMADYDSVFRKAINVLNTYVLDDTKRVIAQVEVETIQRGTEGEDMSYTVREKTQKRFGLFLKKTTEIVANTEMTRTPTNVSSGTARSTTLSRVPTASKSSHGILGHFRSKSQTASHPLGTALYAYEAAGDDEVSISAGEMVTIIEGDDGGWTMVATTAGNQGLVPSSYIETQRAEKKKGPAVAPRRGAKKVSYGEALYNYAATGDDELTLSVGDKVVLMGVDEGGWTEGELNGKTGLFPSSYIKHLS